MLRSPAECPRCGIVQPLIARGDDGAEVCGPCVGFAADYTCRRCGRAGNPHSRGRCAHCVLAERVNALLAGPDGTVAPQMEPLAAALTDAPSPFRAIQWIKESPNTRLLARLAADGHVLGHELLDELPPSRNQRYIRQLLVHTGILEERHEDLERIPGWSTSSRTSRPRTPTSPARSCTGSCSDEHANGPPTATIPPPPTATCGAASASPWTSWPGWTNATWPSQTSPKSTSTTGSPQPPANGAT
ncbi:hypothetical protein QMK19_25990 [Streptomyces sp. H10-C2]|uniref:hypothetical protein n=1 Tax=unclassified Streptomyces TaxID=2593676 RepID=UPI0024B93342|nr:MULTISPECIES: hypothetical protein [unclassified Streptomyces]MDJ0345648.1 hypothetical protein [Streptomyces sp. PH10-H1]MDJ0373013.1 hypothetical protein [Streptomyces sp. H10-C2]